MKINLCNTLFDFSHKISASEVHTSWELLDHIKLIKFPFT